MVQHTNGNTRWATIWMSLRTHGTTYFCLDRSSECVIRTHGPFERLYELYKDHVSLWNTFILLFSKLILYFHLYVVPCVLITHSYFCLVAHLVFPFVCCTMCPYNTFIQHTNGNTRWVAHLVFPFVCCTMCPYNTFILLFSRSSCISICMLYHVSL